MLVFSKVSHPLWRIIRPLLKMTSLMCQFSGGRTCGAPEPSSIVTFSAFASFLWYTRRTPCLMLPASLILIDRSCAVLGAGGSSEPPKKATRLERSTGRCRSTATGSATSAFIFSQLLGLGSAEEFHISDLPSPSSALSVLGIMLAVGLVAFGEAYWLVVCSSLLVYIRPSLFFISCSDCSLSISPSDCVTLALYWFFFPSHILCNAASAGSLSAVRPDKNGVLRRCSIREKCCRGCPEWGTDRS